jgi:hypothetical protein
LKSLTEQIPDKLPKLKSGFQFIVDFEISFRGLIAHRIRQHLHRLTPNKSMPISFKDSLPKEEKQKHFLRSLKFNYEGSLVDCRKALVDFLTEPNQVAYGMVEAFGDQVLRSEGEVAKDEWRKFLQEVRAKVWADQFDLVGEKTQIKQEWLDLVEKVGANNHLDLV